MKIKSILKIRSIVYTVLLGLSLLLLGGAFLLLAFSVTAGVLAYTLIGVFFTLAVLFAGLLTSEVIKGERSRIQTRAQAKIVEKAVRAAEKGYFNVNIPVAEESEFSNLSTALTSLFETISDMDAEINKIIDISDLENIPCKANSEDFSGSWAATLEWINQLLDAVHMEYKKAGELKNRFLVNMSHEIRTPMNAIIGFSDIAAMKDQSEENRETFRKISMAAKNLLSIISNILDFAKIESGNLDLSESDFDLEALAADSFMAAYDKIGDKKVEMLLDIQPDVPCFLFGDKTRLSQIFKNLISNSAKYTTEGRIVLEVSLAPASEATKDPEKTYLKFRVHDTGIGMSEAQLKKLFIPFEQFLTKGSRQNMGTGLGLSLTRQLVLLMGGSIWVDSKPDVGTYVDVVIGFGPARSTATLQEIIGEYHVSAKKILIVDDDKYARKIMQELLAFVSLEASCASSGEEAIALTKESFLQDDPYDLIILDYMMEGKNGIETARDLSEYTQGKTKLLMVSAYTRLLVEKDIKDAGFDQVIEKPFFPSAFIKCLCDTMYAKTEQKKKDDFTPFFGAKILVCEDNEINQEVVAGLLDMIGIVPDIAANGREGIEFLDRQQYHMVFMDVLMPEMNGYEATEAIRNSDKPYKDIPIVAMTANVMQTEIDKCLQCGMNSHVGKPIEMETVYRELVSYLPPQTRKSPVKIQNQAKKEAPAPVKAAPPPAEKDAFQWPDKIEGIDIAQGVARFGGKTQKYFDSLIRFMSDLPDQFESFDDFIQPERHDEACKYIHMLKGVFGNMSITIMFEKTVALELLLKEGRLERETYDNWAQACYDIRKMVMDSMPEEKKEEALPPGSEDELIDLLGTLKTALENYASSDSECIIAKLKAKSWPMLDRAFFVTLYNLAEEFEYSDAAELAEQMMKRCRKQ